MKSDTWKAHSSPANKAARALQAAGRFPPSGLAVSFVLWRVGAAPPIKKALQQILTQASGACSRGLGFEVIFLEIHFCIQRQNWEYQLVSCYFQTKDSDEWSTIQRQFWFWPGLSPWLGLLGSKCCWNITNTRKAAHTALVWRNNTEMAASTAARECLCLSVACRIHQLDVTFDLTFCGRQKEGKNFYMYLKMYARDPLYPLYIWNWIMAKYTQNFVGC